MIGEVSFKHHLSLFKPNRKNLNSIHLTGLKWDFVELISSKKKQDLVLFRTISSYLSALFTYTPVPVANGYFLVFTFLVSDH